MTKEETIDEIYSVLQSLISTVATKDDIANMATKDDIADIRRDMATKDDVKREVQILRTEMELGFEGVYSETSLIKKRLGEVEKRLINIEKMTMEDVSAIGRDVMKISRRVSILEKKKKVQNVYIK